MPKQHILGIMIAAAFILLLPLVALQFTAEVNWGPVDFAVAWVLLTGAGLAYLFVVNKVKESGAIAYKAATGLAVGTILLLLWANGAVGIIGNESQPVNLMYFGVLAVGLVGAMIARFRPKGMAITSFTAALVQLLIPITAQIVWPGLSWGTAGAAGVFVFNAFFVALFVVSGLLFRRANVINSKLHQLG